MWCVTICTPKNDVWEVRLRGPHGVAITLPVADYKSARNLAASLTLHVALPIEGKP